MWMVIEPAFMSRLTLHEYKMLKDHDLINRIYWAHLWDCSRLSVPLCRAGKSPWLKSDAMSLAHQQGAKLGSHLQPSLYNARFGSRLLLLIYSIFHILCTSSTTHDFATASDMWGLRPGRWLSGYILNYPCPENTPSTEQFIAEAMRHLAMPSLHSLRMIIKDLRSFLGNPIVAHAS